MQVCLCSDFLFAFQPVSPMNGIRGSPRENGPDKGGKKDGTSSPRSDASSHASTPSSSKLKEVDSLI